MPKSEWQGMPMADLDGAGSGAVTSRAEIADVHLRAAATAFDVIRVEISELLEEVQAGDTARAKKLRPILSDLARAISVLAKAGELLDDRQGRTEPGVSEPSLDLAAARAEIERRLAQLRAAG